MKVFLHLLANFATTQQRQVPYIIYLNDSNLYVKTSHLHIAHSEVCDWGLQHFDHTMHLAGEPL